jgi:hypothetical protein
MTGAMRGEKQMDDPNTCPNCYDYCNYTVLGIVIYDPSGEDWGHSVRCLNCDHEWDIPSYTEECPNE